MPLRSGGGTGTPGTPGKSAYEIAVINGFIGTEVEWLASLKGADGNDGAPGTPGSNGADGYTPIKGVDYFDGVKGDKGDPGTNGTNGTNGTDGYTPVKNVDYFDGAKGDKGDKGDQGIQGLQGDQGIQGIPGADSFLARLTVSGDKATGANVTPVTLGISFNYLANSTYLIDYYMMVAPTAATTGCGFPIDVSTAVTYVGTFTIHQLATSGTVSGGGTIGDNGVTSSGVSSGMPSTGSNFVSGSALLITGANAGTATFMFRSETTAVTTCKSGSVVRVLKV